MQSRLCFILIAFLVLPNTIIKAQKEPSCHSEAPSSFAALADDSQFREVHQLPGKLIWQEEEERGQYVEFATPDSSTGRAYLINSNSESNVFLFLFHEWYGLNEFVKKEAEYFVDNLPDVNVLAIDLYDGKVAENREQAKELMQGVNNDRALAIILGAASYIGEEGIIGTIGWCFGGGWSLQSSIELGAKSKACVIYYGMPEKDESRLNMLRAKVLGIFASQDAWINAEVTNDFEQKLDKLGKPFELHTFDAAHGFANPSNSIFDEAATEAAKSKTLAFLLENLRQ